MKCTKLPALGCMLLIALGHAQPSLAADAAGVVAAPVQASFMRTMIVVRDLETSKRFYTYALGFRVEREVELNDPISKAQLGIPLSRRARFVLLVNDAVIEGRKRSSASLALLQLDHPDSAPLSRPSNEMLAIGEHVMALRTNDVQTVFARLKELTARFAVQPVTTADGEATELVVYDPDGVRIHVVQRPDSPRDF